ncbi:MAG: HAMP domain-containing sensor histidine kinase [Acidobacteriota bacterium]
MPSRRSTQLVTMFVLSLAATITLLIGWVVYVVRSSSRLAPSGPARGVHWLLLVVGCVLLFFLIVGLIYQLAQALAARRYAQKQDEFVANITHEMKSPLAAIKLHAQTLEREADLSPELRRRFLAIIEQQTDRMASLVDAVLESGRLLAGKRQLDLVPVEVAAFFQAYFATARPHAESRGVHLATDVRSEAWVLGSEEALRRVMDNLIDNAVRFSQPGGEVRCRVATDGAQVRIEVEDDGVGIPKKELPKIFERFHQAQRQGGPHGSGTGLGLSIVSGLVREMRGAVRAYSQEDRPGTRLVVELPIAEAAA